VSKLEKKYETGRAYLLVTYRKCC